MQDNFFLKLKSSSSKQASWPIAYRDFRIVTGGSVQYDASLLEYLAWLDKILSLEVI